MDLGSDFALLGGKGVLDHARDGSLEVGIGDVGDLGGVLVYLLDDVASHEDLASHHGFRLGVGEAAGSCGNEEDVVAFPFLGRDVHEVPVVDWPDALVLHVVDSELVIDDVEGFDFEEHGVDELEGIFLLEEGDHFVNVELDLIDALGGNSAVDLGLEHGAWFVAVFLPLVGGVELFESFEGAEGNLVVLSIVVHQQDM